MAEQRSVAHRDMASAIAALHEFAREIAEIVRGRDCILLDFPDYDNVGDHLIWLGNKVILKRLLGVRVVYQCSYQKVDFGIIDQYRSATILCQGGGNFGDIYPSHQNLREAIVERFPARDVVFLPQTIHFCEEEALDRCATKLLLAHNVTLFARDARSLEIAQKLVPTARARLGIDSAFALSYLIPRLLNRTAVWADRPLYLLRKDRESRSGWVSANARALEVDWQDHEKIENATLTNEEVKKIICDLDLDRLIDAEWEMKSLEYLARASALVASSSEIVTDRLHGHILAMLFGKRNFVLDNTYGKNWDFVDTWTRDDDLVSLLSP